MNDTGFKLRPAEIGWSACISAQPDGALAPIEFGIPQEPEFLMGGGGLYGTARDYIRFVHMLINGGTLDGAGCSRPRPSDDGENHIGDLTSAR